MSTLAELCEFIIDCEHKTAPIQTEGYPSIRTPNIGRGYFILEGVNRVSEEIYIEWTRRGVPRGGDLILAREAPVGNVAVIPENAKFCLGQRTVLIRPNQQIVNSHYLCYLLLSPSIRNELLAKSCGATVHHLNLKDIRAFSIPTLPTLLEQNRLASIIKNYDDLIQTNQQRIALLEEAAQRLYDEWFVKLRFPNHEQVAVVDGVPEGWAIAKLSDLGEVITGKTPSTQNKDYYDGNIPFIKTPDMNGNFYVIYAETNLTEEGANTQPNKSVPPNTPLISCIGTVGVVSLTYKKSQFNQQINAVLCEKDYFVEYTFFVLRRLKPILEGMGGGSTMANVSKGKLENISILKPDDSSVLKFHNLVNSFFEKILTLSIQNQKLAQARDALLPRLMSGKMDVSGLSLKEIA